MIYSIYSIDSYIIRIVIEFFWICINIFWFYYSTEELRNSIQDYMGKYCDIIIIDIVLFYSSIFFFLSF